MLKWEKAEAGSWVGRADGFEYRTVVDFFDSECAQQKAEFQARHDARVASIAAANGYVKLEPGQVVVTMTLVYAAKFRMDDEILQGMETNDEAYAEAIDVIHKFEASAATLARDSAPKAPPRRPPVDFTDVIKTKTQTPVADRPADMVDATGCWRAVCGFMAVWLARGQNEQGQSFIRGAVCWDGQTTVKGRVAYSDEFGWIIELDEAAASDADMYGQYDFDGQEA